MICKWFKKRSARVDRVTKPPVVETVIHPEVPSFFLVVGHNSKSGGTYNYLGESEYSFYLRGFKIVAKYLQELAPIIPTYIVTRPAGVSYNKQVSAVCKKINAITHGAKSYGFNGHFNSTRGATGSEGLVAKGSYSDFDDTFADIYTDLLATLDIRQRYYNGVKELGSGHSGYGMINGMHNVNCTTIIGEPCFDYKYKESVAIFENEERYFKLIAVAIIKTYQAKGLLKDFYPIVEETLSLDQL